jgi:hypothetical protein
MSDFGSKLGASVPEDGLPKGQPLDENSAERASDATHLGGSSDGTEASGTGDALKLLATWAATIGQQATAPAADGN